MAPRLGAGGQFANGIHVLRDVTRERALWQQLVQAERLSAVGRLVSGVAHELNNPLTAILGYAQLLGAAEGLPAEVQAALQAVASEAKRAGDIVRNLLTFAQVNSPQRQQIQVNDVLEQVLRLMEHSLAEDGIAVAKDLAPDLPKTWADASQLQQAFSSLVSNAHQAMLTKGCGGVLTVRSVGDGAEGLLFTIADDGPGIAPELAPAVSDPFFTTKDVGQGTGLGLSICYGIVAQHGGRI
ncbi:MAG: hypothetical protein GX605_08575 [Chloroflexi bacterium]|nr:hypothetical protein [Chloroflexota bacterium]